VQELEKALGEPLFERRASGMWPTPAGRVVLERCERIFAELEELAKWCSARQSRKHSGANLALPTYLLNTRRFQLFTALARHRHMQSAAQSLGISQPAVSSAIRILESGACIQLFHRSPRGLLLTSEGETFLLHGRRALNELRHIPDDIAALHGSIRGSITVGALPLGRTLILPEAIARVSVQYPGVRVVTDESAYESLVAGLRAGDIDFILGALRINDAPSGLNNERLLAEDMIVLARRDHPLARVRGLTLKDLAAAQWILPRSQSPARGLFEALFKQMEMQAPMPTVETADLAIIRGLLSRTDMVAALSARQLHYECESEQLSVLDVAMQNTQRDIGLTVRATGTNSPAARVLIDAIRLAAAEVANITCSAAGHDAVFQARSPTTAGVMR
jgi:LysR family transcriptional regulator of gallate degradation